MCCVVLHFHLLPGLEVRWEFDPFRSFGGGRVSLECQRSVSGSRDVSAAGVKNVTKGGLLTTTDELSGLEEESL